MYNSYIRTASKSRPTPAKLIKWNKDFDNFLNPIFLTGRNKKRESQEKYGFFYKTKLENNTNSSRRNF